VAVAALVERPLPHPPARRSTIVEDQAAQAGEGPAAEEKAQVGSSLGGGKIVRDGGRGRGDGCPGLEQKEDQGFSDHENSLDVNSDRSHVGDYIHRNKEEGRASR